MHRDASKSPARVLAPLALVLCTLAFLVVIISSGPEDGNDDGGSSAQTTTSKRSRTNTTTQPRKTTYVVKEGDSLAGIAEKTGVDVETLQDLNPGLDPQGLVIGQKLKLRE